MRFATVRTIGTVAVLGGLLGPEAIIAQGEPAAPAPCHDRPCVLVFDWGPGKTSSNYGPDRRYGSGDDFEAKVRAALREHGIRTTDAPAGGALTLTLRMRMKEKAMCDQMPGTNTDFSCTAMQELAVTYTSGDPATKPPGAIRISNRCGSNDLFMTMQAFGQYCADMIWYSLEGEKAKARKPVARC
ncbi:MAG TPA: hypothetical protein VJL28_13580 [Gemmatimonadaceae bacterium]|nr:hypothetical protein [Gemmatimonadaceae bacterium]